MKNRADSALIYYDKIFASYDFIFVKDILNAAQIAIFSKRPYLKYIEQGFEQGLKISHLKKYPLFANIYQKLIDNKTLMATYEPGRKKYLEKIDFRYLDWIYKLAIRDQQSKTKSKYNDIAFTITERLMDSVAIKGFPGDRIIGIADSTIFAEINKPYLDLYQQRRKDKNLWYMTTDEDILSPKWPQIILVHNSCSYHLYKDILFNEIKKGNIHPRDVGMIYDNMYRFKGNFPHYCNNVSLKGAYRLNMFTEYSSLINFAETDKMRSQLYIVTLAIDEKKRDFEMEHGFRLFSGFWGCR